MAFELTELLKGTLLHYTHISHLNMFSTWNENILFEWLDGDCIEICSNTPLEVVPPEFKASDLLLRATMDE